ncbi:MAG: glycosyltransferase family 2 protein [Balneola sp.]
MEKNINHSKEILTVTIAIPVLNEEKYIERVLSLFSDNKEDNIIQICVADGGSVDRTREIVRQYSEKDERIILVENPEKFQSFGLNRILEIAEGDLFLRADGHCIYAPDYVKKSVEAIKKSGAVNVGGTQRYIAKNRVQSGVALSTKNFFGNGGAKYMDETFEGYADTVFLGCFKTDVLKKLGGFSEVNRTNEDAEINLRIRKEVEGKIYVSTDIKTWYYPRSSLITLLKQYFRYGRGRQITNQIHEGDIPYRSKAPFYFVSFMLSFCVLDFILIDKQLGAFYILLAITLLILFESIRFSFEKREYFENEIWSGAKDRIPHPLTNSIFCFMSLVVMNAGHFLGYGFQLIKTAFLGRINW